MAERKNQIRSKSYGPEEDHFVKATLETDRKVEIARVERLGSVVNANWTGNVGMQEFFDTAETIILGGLEQGSDKTRYKEDTPRTVRLNREGMRFFAFNPARADRKKRFGVAGENSDMDTQEFLLRLEEVILKTSNIAPEDIRKLLGEVKLGRD